MKRRQATALLPQAKLGSVGKAQRLRKFGLRKPVHCARSNNAPSNAQLQGFARSAFDASQRFIGNCIGVKVVKDFACWQCWVCGSVTGNKLGCHGLQDIFRVWHGVC